MNTEYGYLVINLHTIGLEEQDVEMVYRQNYINELDKETYAYQNEEEYFNQNKEDILNKLNLKRERYGIIFEILDIRLNKIYIKIGNLDKRIQSLFKMITIKGVPYKLEDILMQKIKAGNLFRMYQLDKKRVQEEEFETIFKGLSPWLLECLELKIFHFQKFSCLLDNFKTQIRYFEIIRFLLSTPENLTMENFKKTIPAYEGRKRNKEETNVMIRKQWLPYSDKD